MCMMSVVLDYGRNRVPRHSWDQPAWDAFKRSLDSAKEFDEKAKEPDCEDPAKAEWMKEVEERLAKLEERAKAKVLQH